MMMIMHHCVVVCFAELLFLFMHCFGLLAVKMFAPQVKCAYLMMMNGGMIFWLFLRVTCLEFTKIKQVNT
jgi:hypothetical protein